MCCAIRDQLLWTSRLSSKGLVISQRNFDVANTRVAIWEMRHGLQLKVFHGDGGSSFGRLGNWETCWW